MSKTKTAPAPAASSADVETDAYVDLEAAAEAAQASGAALAPAAVNPWLTTAASEGFGPAGHILDLTDDEVATAPDGLLVAPTPEQLAQRL